MADVIVRSVPDEKFTQMTEAGSHHLFVDEPESAGGANKGATPYDHLLIALGT